MKAWFVLILLLAPAAGQIGKVNDDFVVIVADPDFEYSSDQDVVVPMQFRAYRQGLPQSDQVRVEIWTEGHGQRVPVVGGQEWLNNGVAPHPSTANVNFGRLEAGQYRLLVTAAAGSLRTEQILQLTVILPPVRYEATLQDKGNKEAVFEAISHNPEDVLTVTMYRGGATRHILDRVQGNDITLPVPYYPQDSVFIDVVGPNGWANYENRQLDLASGKITRLAWEWNPDWQTSQNAQDNSWKAMTLSATLIGGLIVLLVVGAVKIDWSKHDRR